MGATHQRSTGYRAGTRDLFSKKFRTKTYNPNLTTNMRTFRVGDMVDIIANPAQQKGMPHKYYHGRTGKVWNVNKRAIGARHPGIVDRKAIRQQILQLLVLRRLGLRRQDLARRRILAQKVD